VIVFNGHPLKITEVALIFGLLLCNDKSYVLIVPKNGWGYILGDFFHKLSGSPCLCHKAPNGNFNLE
jgi:hypothetical protein